MIEYVVQDLEVVFDDAVLAVVGPTLDDRVERVDETRLRCTAMSFGAFPQEFVGPGSPGKRLDDQSHATGGRSELMFWWFWCKLW